MQELGDAERSMELASLNGMSITDDLAADTILIIPDYDTSKRNYIQLFSDAANKPAAADISGNNTVPPEGIGYWYLENDFIVQ